MLAEVTLPAGPVKRIHVNSHRIKHNHQTGERLPVFTVKCGGKSYAAVEVNVWGHSFFVYSEEKPLPCGARVWLETFGAVTVWERPGGPCGQPPEPGANTPLPPGIIGSPGEESQGPPAAPRRARLSGESDRPRTASGGARRPVSAGSSRSHTGGRRFHPECGRRRLPLVSSVGGGFPA